MTGFMFKVIDDPSTVRWYLVAIGNYSGAEMRVRAIVGNSVELDSRPMPQGVFEFLGMSAGQVLQWSIG